MFAQREQSSQPRILFNEKGLVMIEKCPKCNSKRFNLIDHNNWFHCWDCRHVCLVSDIQGVSI